MKKIVGNLLLMISLSFTLLQSMEMINLTKDTNDTNTATPAISNNNIQVNINDINAELTPQSSPIKSQSPQVPRLNLNSTLVKTKSNKNTLRTPITSHNQLIQQVNQAKKTHRQMMSDSSSQLNGKQGDIAIEINNIVKKRSVLPRGLGSSNNDIVMDIAQDTMYTIEQVWDMLKSTNPTLHQFGIENNLSLDDVVMYGNLLNDFHVHPEALVEFVKNNCNVKLPNKKFSLGEEKGVLETQIQKYQKIQSKDPEKYKALVLDVLKTVVSEQDEQPASSPLNDTHIQLLEKQLADSESTKRYQYIALGVSFIMWIGGFAWGIYGQVTGTPTSAPTRAPTMAPTSMPTLMPTGTPT